MGLEQSEEEALACSKVKEALLALHGLVEVPALKVLRDSEVSTAARRAVEEWYVSRATKKPVACVVPFEALKAGPKSREVCCRDFFLATLVTKALGGDGLRERARATMRDFARTFWRGQAIGPPGTCRDKFGAYRKRVFFGDYDQRGKNIKKRDAVLSFPEEEDDDDNTLGRLRGLFVAASVLKVRLVRARCALSAAPGKIARTLAAYERRKKTRHKRPASKHVDRDNSPSRETSPDKTAVLAAARQAQRAARKQSFLLAAAVAKRSSKKVLSKTRGGASSSASKTQEKKQAAAILIQGQVRRYARRQERKAEVALNLWRRVRRQATRSLAKKIETRATADRCARTLQATWLKWVVCKKKKTNSLTWIAVRSQLRQEIARRRALEVISQEKLARRQDKERLVLQESLQTVLEAITKQRQDALLLGDPKKMQRFGSPVLDVLRQYENAPMSFFKPTMQNVFQKLCEPHHFLTDLTAHQAITFRKMTRRSSRRRRKPDYALYDALDDDHRHSDASYVSDRSATVSSFGTMTLDDVLSDPLPLIGGQVDDDNTLPPPREGQKFQGSLDFIDEDRPATRPTKPTKPTTASSPTTPSPRRRHHRITASSPGGNKKKKKTPQKQK